MHVVGLEVFSGPDLSKEQEQEHAAALSSLHVVGPQVLGRSYVLFLSAMLEAYGEYQSKNASAFSILTPKTRAARFGYLQNAALVSVVKTLPR
jgi:hypothetical protein